MKPTTDDEKARMAEYIISVRNEVDKYIGWADHSIDRADESPGDVALRHILRAIAYALIAIAKK